VGFLITGLKKKQKAIENTKYSKRLKRKKEELCVEKKEKEIS